MEEHSVHMDGIARQNASPFFWYPFFDVIQDLLGDEVLGERGLQTRFRQTTLRKTFVYWGLQYTEQGRDEPPHVSSDTIRACYCARMRTRHDVS